MIEKEDIENDYNMILCENESEPEEIMTFDNKVALFSSP